MLVTKLSTCLRPAHARHASLRPGFQPSFRPARLVVCCLYDTAWFYTARYRPNTRRSFGPVRYRPILASIPVAGIVGIVGARPTNESRSMVLTLPTSQTSVFSNWCTCVFYMHNLINSVLVAVISNIPYNVWCSMCLCFKWAMCHVCVLHRYSKSSVHSVRVANALACNAGGDSLHPPVAVVQKFVSRIDTVSSTEGR